MTSLSSFSSELKLLLAACFGTVVPAPENFDSGRLQKLVSYHGIRPQFLAFIHQNNLDISFRSSLAGLCQNIAINNLLSVRQQAEIIKLLENNGIQSYAYKGSLWAEWLYGDVGKREFGDIDLLIKPAQFEPAIEVLKSAGYLPDEYRQYLLDKPDRKADFFKTDYHIPLVNTSLNTSSMVEAHWQVAYPRLCFDFFSDEWDKYQETYSLHKSHIKGFSNEYQFLLLLVHHGGKEQWSRIKYIADFSAYLKSHGSNTNWKLVEELAKSKGILKLYKTSLGLLKALGLPWQEGWPENIIPTNPLPLDLRWEIMPAQEANSTWPYFIHGISIHDGFKHKSRVVFAHLKYFMKWRLLFTKMKWYSQNKPS
ncbi:nucleotidyltransferase domain-containing protein [Dyadobacter psychrotolerans]|uniref:Nucleotidyltransferase family protein n=1 Tax=Dyadobacter psychrotolerans TaxID=2541721 RepID=A0A4R5DPT6_9BACT|nr:nucleotidyltransferase family protein [Dyadobacter psychrotolerans]TDE16269.1 hypothetical protein E0F88_08450 [Dyadobacter psychrotolerans]